MDFFRSTMNSLNLCLFHPLSIIFDDCEEGSYFNVPSPITLVETNPN